MKYTRGDKIRENEFNSHRIHKKFAEHRKNWQTPQMELFETFFFKFYFIFKLYNIVLVKKKKITLIFRKKKR